MARECIGEGEKRVQENDIIGPQRNGNEVM
jgi:hypothetical protein